MDFLENKQYKIIWLNSFTHELSHIYYYLSNILKETSTANKFHIKVVKLISTLSYFPEKYPRLHHNTDIRKIPIDKYIILYKFNRNTRSSFYSTYIS